MVNKARVIFFHFECMRARDDFETGSLIWRLTILIEVKCKRATFLPHELCEFFAVYESRGEKRAGQLILEIHIKTDILNCNRVILQKTLRRKKRVS